LNETHSHEGPHVIRAARYAYAFLAWAFLVGLVVQVFFIGLGLFADGKGIELHQNLGWILHLAPLLVLAAAAVSRAGQRHWLSALALAVVVFIVPILATMRDGSPVIAALHPVAAVLAFWLAIVVAQNSIAAFREPFADAEQTPAT
jgi:hypothetical protein